MAKINSYKRTGIHPYRYPALPSKPIQQVVGYRTAGRKKYQKPIVNLGNSSVHYQSDFKTISVDVMYKHSVIYFAILLAIGLAFISAQIRTGANPLDLMFGNGEGEGGILNIISDYGEDIKDSIVQSTDIAHKFSIVNIDAPTSTNVMNNGILGNLKIIHENLGWGDVLSQLLSISVFVVNFIIKTLLLIFRLIMFVMTGGAVTI